MDYSPWNGCVLKLSETRVWRTYTGGAKLDQWRNKTTCSVGNFPEDWVASTTRARNPGREDILEGYSRVLNIPDEPYLKNVLLDQPENYFGTKHLKQMGPQLGMLIKLIDANERLTIQTHPDRTYAKKFFGSDYGKPNRGTSLIHIRLTGKNPAFILVLNPA